MNLPRATLVTTALLNRRAALGALGALTVAGCGGGSGDSATATTSASTSDASLSALLLSAGNLSPAFSAATTNYSIAVDNSVTTTTVTATSSAGGATSVNGSSVASGATSAAINLQVGSNVLSIVVTASDGTTTRSYTVTVTRAAATAGNCTLIPEETQGPFPLLAILSNSAVVRSDIRESETGMPLRLDITLLNTNNACVPITNAAVYIWHCNSAGEYSGYSGAGNGNHVGETFLRGVQVTDAAGQVSFTTIYPGWYAGRVTHIHVQVYLNDALNVTAQATTQLAFPEAITTAVYATYAKGQNTSVPTNAADNVFSDGVSLEMLSVTGDNISGYVATMTVSIAA